MRLTIRFLLIPFLGFSQVATQTMVPVTATVTYTTTKRVSGTSTDATVSTVAGKYVRDSQGRTRIERGQQVTIQDPVAGQDIELDLNSRIATVRSLAASAPPTASAMAAPGTMPATKAVAQSRIVKEPLVDLGSEIVNGEMAKGVRATVRIPIGAMGNIVPIVHVQEVWRSESLRMPIRIKTTHSLNGEQEESYTNIVHNAVIDPGLFLAPPDFRVVTRP